MGATALEFALGTALLCKIALREGQFWGDCGPSSRAATGQERTAVLLARIACPFCQSKMGVNGLLSEWNP